jgi:hypothetical protein
MRKFAFKRKATQATDIGTSAPDIQYDLFAVNPDNCALWLETITELENAEQRMKGLAAESQECTLSTTAARESLFPCCTLYRRRASFPQ